MTQEEIAEILQELELDYEAQPTLVYVFYTTPDGRVNNFSISVRRAKKMSDKKIVELMRKEYPEGRRSKVNAVERPKATIEKHDEWMESAEVCQMLKVTGKTLRRWRKMGLFHPSQLGRYYYYLRAEVEEVLRSNVIDENGRLDTSFDLKGEGEKMGTNADIEGKRGK